MSLQAIIKSVTFFIPGFTRVSLVIGLVCLGCDVEVSSNNGNTDTTTASDSAVADSVSAGDTETDSLLSDSNTGDSETGEDSASVQDYSTDSQTATGTEAADSTDAGDTATGSSDPQDTDSLPDRSSDDGCSAAAVAGSCSVDRLDYCDSGSVAHLDCAIVGETCAVNDGRADCAPVDRSTACGALSPLGECVENTIRWCDETKIMAFPTGYDCGVYGRICDPTTGEDGGAVCLSHGECGDVDAMGICEENTLRYCDVVFDKDGQPVEELFVFDCGADQCATVEGLADCFATGIGLECGTETEDGRCDGEQLVRCLESTITREDCAALGMTCAPGAPSECVPAAGCPAGCATGYSCVDGKCVGPADSEREWTIAVYMVGNNNLSNAVWQDLNEMEAATLPDSVSVVAEFELSEQYTSLAPQEYRTGSYRLEIAHDEDSRVVSSMNNATALGNLDMTDPANVTDFAAWAAETYPSKKFAFLFWDHGFGWRGGFVDSSTLSVMSLKDIVVGLRDSGTNPDLVGFDACMMGMQEVAMALRGITDTLVASEEAVPGGGYPYTEVLNDLAGAPTSDAVTLGQMIADNYTEYFETGLRARSVTMSVLDLREAAAVNASLAAFSKTFIEELPGLRSVVRDTIRDRSLLRYQEKDSADLIATMTAFESIGGGMGAAATGFKDWFGGSGFVLDSMATLNVAESSGVAIHLPANAYGQYSANMLAEYRESTDFLPLEPWHGVIANLTETAAGDNLGDGINAFSVELSWVNTADGENSDVDLDLIVVEPSGEEAAAANGAVTSNGLLSADSVDSGMSYESYELRSRHQSGYYIILVHLFMDEGDTAPVAPVTPEVTIHIGGDTLIRQRGYVVDREIVQVPMDSSVPLEGNISAENAQQVLDLSYTTLWHVATLEVR